VDRRTCYVRARVFGSVWVWIASPCCVKVATTILNLLAPTSNAFHTPFAHALLAGVFTIGAAANTGIMLGSFAMLMGLLQVVSAMCGSRNGPLVIYGDSLSQASTLLVQVCAAIVALTVAAVGIMCIVAVVRNSTGVVGLRWCESDSDPNKKLTNRECWLGTDQSDYALGSYGASLLVLGLFACAVDLRLLQQAASLQGWNVLGPLYIVLGALTLGAVGNTGTCLGGGVCLRGKWVSLRGRTCVVCWQLAVPS
jgi:hypothetical protein